MSNNSVEYILSLKDKFSSGIKSATTNTEKLNKSVNVAQKSLSNLGGALGIGLGAAGVVSFGKAVVDSLVNYEYFSTSLRTLMKGNAQAAKALENQLVETAKTTPFSLVEVQDATKQLLAYGFSAGSVVKNIRMLGDVASALKIPFADIAYLYGTLKTQGRAFSKDIMQFTGRGIPIVKENGDNCGNGIVCKPISWLPCK
jgi:phage tail tape-measure protein